MFCTILFYFHSRIKELSEEFHLTDWIHDVQWLTANQKPQNSFAIISAHNCLTVWDWGNGPKNEFQCAENCILYPFKYQSILSQGFHSPGKYWVVRENSNFPQKIRKIMYFFCNIYWNYIYQNVKCFLVNYMPDINCINIVCIFTILLYYYYLFSFSCKIREISQFASGKSVREIGCVISVRTLCRWQSTKIH